MTKRLTSQRFPVQPRSRWMGMLSYLGVLCLIPLIFSHNDPFVHFHSRQGLVLWIWGVLAIFSLHIPVLGAFFFSSSVFFITLLTLVGLLSVMLSRTWRIPVIGALAGKF
ncbi:MAG: hypothetical protein HQL80_12390 [Magnetococcales bacterium]|nr:hypothetical protein [Magnetococcales bacterium]